MKKIYQSPKVQVMEIQLQTILMMSTSDEVVEGDNGGWVKEDAASSLPGGKSIWDDDWDE